MLRDLIQKRYTNSFSEEQINQVVEYRNLVVRGNETQNLTRLISEEDFFYGHVVDSAEYSLSLENEEGNFLDLGTGCGVPGILCSIFSPKTKWVLTESEEMKRVFLRDTVERLNLSTVSVASDRAEVFLSNYSGSFTIVSKAVGSVQKIYNLLQYCSTWNNLVLFKGKSWEEEYAAFQNKKNLQIYASHTYETKTKLGETKVSRIISLRRAR